MRNQTDIAPETTEQVSKRIQRALSRTDNSFALFFAIINLPESRERITKDLIKQIKRPVIELKLSSEALQDTTLDNWLNEQLNNQAEDAIIFLYGIDRVIPSQKEALRKYLQQLNWRRSALAAIKRPLVIWLPRYVIDNLAEYAPDFYDWYSNVYEFTSDTQLVEKYKQQFQTEFSTDVSPAERMSHKEKKKWLHTLTTLLDENTEKNRYRAKLLNDLGRLHSSLGNKNDALDYYSDSLRILQKIGDKAGEGRTLNNISQIYHDRGDYETTLKYLKQSLNIQQEIGDKAGEGITLNNISQIYDARGDYETALKYLKQSLNIRQEIGDKAGEGMTLNNISAIYNARGDYETALKYLKQSLNIQQEIGDKAGEGTTLNNISQIFNAKGDYETALNYLKQSLNIRQEIGDSAGLCATLFNMGHIYLQNGNQQEAMATWISVYKIAKPMGLAQILEALENLAGQLGLEGGLQAWEMLAEKMGDG